METSLTESVNTTSGGTDINENVQDVYQTSGTMLTGATVSQGLFDTLLNASAYLSLVLGVPGIIANILIIVTYTKMGIKNSINASYTAMAVSDVGCVVTTMWFEILLIPKLSTWESLPFIPAELSSTTAAYPNMAFAKTTACITAYISLERCLCVAFPHKVKLLFTKRLTVTVLVFIYIFNAVPAALTAVRRKLVWKMSPIVPNKTVLGRERLTTSVALVVTEIQNWLYGTVYQWGPIAITVICSIFLAVYLRLGSKWRNKAADPAKKEDKEDAKSIKEERIIKTVLTISVLSVALSTPVSINFIFSEVAPQYSPYVFERGVGTLLAAFATFMTMVNSCLNILIYYRLGTKFRSTLRQLLNIKKNDFTKHLKQIDAN